MRRFTKVRGLNSLGQSSRPDKRRRSFESLEARLALDGAPSSPISLAVSESIVAGAVNVALSWSPSTDLESGIKNYKVFRNGTLIGSPTVTSLVDPALSAAAIAQYTVVAVNNADVESDPSAALWVAQLQQGVSNGGVYAGMIDSWINQVTPTQQNGNATTLRVDGEDGTATPPNPPPEQMILLRWDVSALPTDAVVQSASLILNINDASAGQNYNMYPLRTAWTELGVTYQVAQAGDPWEAAGARGPTDRSSNSIGTIGSSNTAKLRFALNAAGRDEIAAWASGAQQNHGIIISDTPTGTLNNALEFSSSEATTAANRPLLFVAYALPQPVIPSQLTVKHPPRLQLGDAPLSGEPGSLYDQAEVLWQTEVTGEGLDSFTVDYRHYGSSFWVPAEIHEIATGVGTRVVHSAKLTGLMFDQPYEYRVQHRTNGSLVRDYQQTFQTRLMPGSPEAFSFVAYGDPAAGAPPADLIEVQNRINQLNPDFALLLGNNAFADPSMPSATDGSHLAFDARYDPTLNAATTAFVANHIEYPTYGRADLATNDGRPSFDNFSVPQNGPIDDAESGSFFADLPELNYSFEYGNVHFATFDGSTLFGETSSPGLFADQLSWLAADLAASDAPWKVVYTHYPIIAYDLGHFAGDHYYDQLLATLLEADVDLLLSSESLTYQRSYPLTGESGGLATFVNDPDNNYAHGAGLVQMVLGTSGRGPNNADFTGATYLARAFSATTTPSATAAVAKFDVVGNVLRVNYVAADDGAVLDTFSITAAAPIVTPLQTLPLGETVWRAADGPRHVTGNITVPVGATLRIEPGLDVSFAAGVGLIVNGRLVAEGTPHDRISLSAPSGSTTDWAGIRFVDTLEDNRLSYIDMSDALSRADAIFVQGSRLVIDHVVWSEIDGNVLELDEVDLAVRNSVFPEVDVGEPIESNSGVQAWGRFILGNNIFGRSLGNSDTVDFEGGIRTGRMMQVYGNVFYGGPDEAIDFDVDAHIEGNIFMSNLESLGSPEPNGTTSSISTGPYIVPDPNDPGETMEIPSVVTITRNIFYLVDQAVGIKQGTFVNFINNTVIGAQVAALNFYDPSRMTDPGAGALVEGTIFYNTAVPFGHVDESQNGPGTFDTNLIMNNSMVDGSLPPAVLTQLMMLGMANLSGNPLFVDPTRDFHLRPGSPAIGTGPGGIDMGAFVPPTIPSVLGVSLRNTTWSPAMLARLAADHGVAGVPLLLNASSETAATLPWSGIDEITIRFSEDVLVPPDALKLSGVNVPEYAIASFVFDTTTDTGIWKLATPIDADKLLLTLDDSVTDLIELPLDGDATGAATSGNGSAGGDLQVRFTVLPGDVSASGSVGLEDVSAIVAGAFRISTDLDYQASRDLNGDGRINMVDAVLANNRGGSALPGGEPFFAGSPAAASSVAASSIVRATRRGAVEEPSDDRAVARARQAARRAVDEAFAAAESITEHLSTLGSDRVERTLRRSVRTR